MPTASLGPPGSCTAELMPSETKAWRSLLPGKVPQPTTCPWPLIAVAWLCLPSKPPSPSKAIWANGTEPPPEIAATGHDRCIIPIKPENIDARLNPDPKNLAAQYAILDARERPYYEHRLAAWQRPVLRRDAARRRVQRHGV